MNIHPGAVAFGLTAEQYERSRPSYPTEAIDWIVDVVPLCAGDPVVDLAAGTGKLTRLLVERGFDVTAVEPVAEMRAVLQTRVPEARVLDGTAESIPLADGAARAVTVAQAYHWFDPERAPREIARVLQPEGALVILANVLDKPSPVQTDLERLVGRYRGRYPNPRWPETLPEHPVFVHEYRSFPHEEKLEPETLVDRVSSISWIGSLPAAEHERVLAETRELVALMERPIVVRWVTQVFVCHRR